MGNGSVFSVDVEILLPVPQGVTTSTQTMQEISYNTPSQI